MRRSKRRTFGKVEERERKDKNDIHTSCVYLASPDREKESRERKRPFPFEMARGVGSNKRSSRRENNRAAPSLESMSSCPITSRRRRKMEKVLSVSFHAGVAILLMLGE